MATPPTAETATRRVTPSQMKRLIAHSMHADIPLMMWGPPGVGKSDLVWQVGREQNRMVIDIRLLLMDPTDIKGIPYYNPASGKMEWAPPSELPFDQPDCDAILFLDELNAAVPGTMAAAYQLTLNKRVGPFTLGPRVSIVAAGNRESDRAVTYKMPSALRNRFGHQELMPSLEDFNAWGDRNGISPLILGYLEFNPDDLFNFDPKSASRAFCTPRSWAFTNRYLLNPKISDADLMELVIGQVGEAAGLQFMSFRKLHQKLPSVIDILTGKLKTLKGKEHGMEGKDARLDLSVKYSLAIALSKKVKEIETREIEQDGNIGDGFNTASENFFKFMLSNFEADLTVMAVRRCLKNHDLFFDAKSIPSYKAFSDRFGHLLSIPMATAK